VLTRALGQIVAQAVAFPELAEGKALPRALGQIVAQAVAFPELAEGKALPRALVLVQVLAQV